MPVTRPLLSCSPFLSFQSTLRASGQSCAQCPSFLHNLHFVQVEKSCSLLAHTAHISCAASHAALICTTASCISLSPLIQRPALLVLVHSAAVVLPENSEVGVEFQCTPAKPLGRCVFCIFTLAVPNSPYFHVGNTNIHKHTVS